MLDVDKIVKKLELMGISTSIAGAGLAKVNDKRSAQKEKIKQTKDTITMFLNTGVTDLHIYIKGKLVASMQESYQTETNKLKKL